MKLFSHFIWIGYLLVIPLLCEAQQATTSVLSPTPYAVASMDRNENIWQRTVYQEGPSGQIIAQKESYKEEATGLNFKNPATGQWMPSKEEIDILPDGTGAATNGNHQAYFPSEIYNGAITLVTPDGLQLKSQPVGLYYDDGTNLALIAGLTNSVGELISSNQVIYTNAFAGVDADLLYTYRKNGFEQEVVLRQQLPPPEAVNMDENARLEMVTEFFDAPEPEESAPVAGQDGLTDVTLTFGAMKMVRGRAFSIGDSGLTNSPPGGIPVCKSWEQMGNRTFLVEALPYEQIAPELNQLSAKAPTSSLMARLMPAKKTLMTRLFPVTRLRQAKRHETHIASVSRDDRSGVVLDYTEVLGNETNLVLQGDTTYLITGELDLFGTTTIEGGTVVKFTKGAAREISIFGPINCKTTSYDKAAFTASDDNSVGGEISGSSGDPVGTYAKYAINYEDGNDPVVFHDLAINYANYAIYFDGTTTNVVRDVQFVNDGEFAIFTSDPQDDIENVLFDNVSNACIGAVYSTIDAENLTVDDCGTFLASGFDTSLALTNSLLIASGLGASFVGADNATNASDSGVFQTVGGGSHYLAPDSPYRGVGTANIDPVLLADLAQKTTWPPIVYDGTNISSLTTLSLTVPRDTNSSPDLGYHYSSLDYAFGGCDLYSNLTFTPGTAVGWFIDYGGVGFDGGLYSISLNGGATLSFNGNATQPCYFSRFSMVQEGENGGWANLGYNVAILFNGGSSSPSPLLSANFTKWTGDGTVNIFRDTPGYGSGVFKNCELYNGTISTYEIQSLTFTNCLLFRLDESFWDSPNLTYENCTFYNGGMDLDRSSPMTWFIENCSYDGTAINWSDSYDGNPAYTTFNYNAYNTNNLSWQTYPYYQPYYVTNEVVGPKDLMVTNYNWESSWFGDFYLPTNSPLIEAGSTNANFLGLYHFTTQTNQLPEGTNVVDIGYHYVATDPYGNPLDSNGDGIPDYLEDAAGNGSGNWDTTLFLNVIITQPENGSTLP